MPNFIQRVYVVVEAGNDETNMLTMTPLDGPKDIPADKHYRDERAIAQTLRELADEIEKGVSFTLCRLDVGTA